jgi:hypothetical protein
MAVNDVLFHQLATVEFLSEENRSVANIFDSLHHVYGDSCVGASSV